MIPGTPPCASSGVQPACPPGIDVIHCARNRMPSWRGFPNPSPPSHPDLADDALRETRCTRLPRASFVAPLAAATPADAVYAPLVMEAGTWDANVTWEFKGDTRIFTVYQLGARNPIRTRS